MSASDLVLAAALLAAPAGTPEPVPTADRWPQVQAAIHQTAVEWELLDPREVRYVLSRVEDYECDLTLLRRRHAELADAPKVVDAGRFPDRATVNEMVNFNRAFRKTLERRMAWETDRTHQFAAALAETDRLYRVWDTVRDARCDFYYITVRRQALKKLKELIGSEAYVVCDLPPHVPEWAFSESR
jgi:hypothetical protein